MPNRPQSLHSIYGDSFAILHYDVVSSLFADWRDEPVYLVARLKNGDKFVTWKAAKRGNDIYIKNINARFRNLTSKAAKHRGKALFITFTNQYPYGYSWKEIGIAYNRILTRIRQKYPDYIGSIRFFEAFKNGYPHIHAILFFRSTRHINIRWIYSRWRYYVKIKRVYSIKGLLLYARKNYLLKDFKDCNTVVMCWYYSKRQYAVSHKLLSFLDYQKRISKLLQTNLFGEVIKEEWILIGVYTKEEVEIFLEELPCSAKVIKRYQL